METNEITSFEELIQQASERGIAISQVVLEREAAKEKTSTPAVFQRMERNLTVMDESVQNGLKEIRSKSGLSGGMAPKLQTYLRENGALAGEIIGDAMVRALAVSEYNACMGRIVAAPTAGSCGILPAVLLTVAEHKGLSREKTVMGLFNAAGVGGVINRKACLSGAQGGCQAECGSASAMAASAAVELLGGTPEQCGNAAALALKFVMGLVCDPVAGLVEVPCVKRNASGAANAIVAAQLALAGINSAIPVDQVIEAMGAVGMMMHCSLKETSKGGIAATPCARALEKRMRENS